MTRTIVPVILNGSLYCLAKLSPLPTSLQELAKARARLEKATTESTELVFDYAARALAKGLDKVITGEDAIKEGEESETLQVST